MRTLSLLCGLIGVTSSDGALLFSSDYNITGFGVVDTEVFSTDFSVDAVSVISSLEIELSHSYVGELVLTLRSPTGELFSILDHDGARTRVGAGNGLLSGVESYTFIDPAAAALSAADWDFTGYQPGGTYGAREWASGEWDAGIWNLTLFNDDVSFAIDGVVGSVRLSGRLIPEPSGMVLFITGVGLGLVVRRR